MSTLTAGVLLLLLLLLLLLVLLMLFTCAAPTNSMQEISRRSAEAIASTDGSTSCLHLDIYIYLYMIY